MNPLLTILIAAALMATHVLASVDATNDIHALSVRRNAIQKRGKCSSGTSSKKHHKSKKHHHNKHSSGGSSGGGGNGGSSSSSSSGGNTASEKTSDTTLSTNGGASGSGHDLKLKSKQGLAWPNANGMDIKNFLTGGVSWYYSWSDTPKWDSAPTDVVFCPMLWGTGGSGGNLDGWKKNVLNNPNGKYNKWKCMMGPNEVNQQGQADMSPSETCSALRKYMMPLADQGWYFIGPSTTSAPNGLTQWYAEFKKDCPDVFNRLDAIALHWYDVNTADFKKYVENWHTTMGKPVWITEFACQNFNGGAQCSKDQANAMMSEMSDWFMKQDYVVGFSPFGVMQNLQGVSEVNRLSTGSSPTNLFRMFAGAK